MGCIVYPTKIVLSMDKMFVNVVNDSIDNSIFRKAIFVKRNVSRRNNVI